MQNDTLPEPITKQPQTTEARHQRHQAMLEMHREEKAARRLRHRLGWHKMKVMHVLV